MEDHALLVITARVEQVFRFLVQIKLSAQSLSELLLPIVGFVPLAILASREIPSQRLAREASIALFPACQSNARLAPSTHSLKSRNWMSA
jgi:hypothetical protein